MTNNEPINRVFDDLKQNMENTKVCTIFIICAVISFGSFFISDKTMKEICKNLISIFPSLLGFTITALAILYSLNKESINKLLKPADDGTIPFDVLFTSFTLSALVQLLSIILALVYLIIQTEKICPFIIIDSIAYLSSFMSLFSVGLIFDIILHLFSIRSFLKY